MFLVTLHDCIKCLPEDIETVREELKRTFNKYGIDPKLKKEFHGIEKIIEAKSCPPPPEAHGLKELFLAIEEQKKPTITKQEIADRFFNGTSIKTVERFLKKYPQLKKLKETDSNRIAYFPLDEIIKCLEQEKTSHARRNQ